MIVPGRLTLLAAVVLGILLVAAVVAPFMAPLIMLCDVALVAACMVQGRSLRRLAVDVRVEPRENAQVGRAETFTYAVSNRSARPVVVHVRQAWPAGLVSDEDRFELRVAPGEVVRAALRAVPRVRGRIAVPPATVDVRFARDVARVRRGTAGWAMKVLPSLRGLGEYEVLRRRHATGLAGLHAQRMVGAGREFEQLRDYGPDDDFRDVNWKATARRHHPITNTYQAERSRELLLCLDCGRMMGDRVGGATALDHAVDASIMLAHVANRQGDRTGLVLFGDTVHRFVKPMSGTPAMHRIVDELAAARAEPVFPSYAALIAALRAHQSRRAIAFLFTDLNDPQLAANLAGVLPAVGRRHVLVVISLRDPALDRVAAGPADDARRLYEVLAARQLAGERAARTRELRRLGATVLEADAGTLTVRLLNTYLAIKARQVS